jgi:hypothetical protein
MDEREKRLAELVNGVRKLKEEKAEAMKGFRDAIDAEQVKVDALAFEILNGQKSLLDVTRSDE